MRDREGFVFLSAPGSITPSHIDPEHNFLLQVRGTKELNVGRFPDSRTEQLELERYYRGEHRNVPWLPEEARVFQLTPGDGIYVPVHAPHFVRNGEQASVSLSVTFFTPETHRAAAVHSFNGKARRLHLSPRPPGQHRTVDGLKATTTRVVRRAAHLLHVMTQQVVVR
jgi:ribosomal protein L16 Arg81 hydroxylase